MIRFVCQVLMIVVFALPALAEDYDVAYHVRILPDVGIAAVTIRVTQIPTRTEPVRPRSIEPTVVPKPEKTHSGAPPNPGENRSGGDEGG